MTDSPRLCPECRTALTRTEDTVGLLPHAKWECSSCGWSEEFYFDTLEDEETP